MVKIAGTLPQSRILDLSTGGSQTVAGTPVMVVNGDGKVGIGLTNPSTQFANNSGNTVGNDGVGLNAQSLNWSMNNGGYAAGIYNQGTGSNNNGLAVKVASSVSGTRILDLSAGAAQSTAGTSVMVVKADGKVGIGIPNPDGSALLDITSTTRGMLIPRMSKTEKNGILSPATGLLIFQNAPDSIGFYYYNGSNWTWMFSNSNADSLAWRTGGNSGTTINNFLGTRTNNPLIIKTNDAEVARFTGNKELGIGTTTPNSTYGFAKVEIASEGYGSPTDLLIRNAVNDGGYAPGLIFQHARGTLATPTAVNNGDYLSAIGTMNYDGSNYVLSAGLDIYADGTISTGIVPTRLMFNTMNTTGSYATRLTIKNDGKVGIGTTNPSSLLSNNNGSTAGIDGFGLNTNSFNWSMTGAIGYVGGLFNASTAANTSGLVVKVAGTGISNRILDLSTNATQNAPGTPVMIVSGNGTVGIGTGSPISQLANTGTNIIGIDGQGINSPSIAWASNNVGYTAAFYNASSNPIAHGINIKIAGTGTNNRILDLSTSPTQLGVGTSVLVANGNGTVGIGTAAPNSTLHVDGTLAIGTSLNIAGGPSGTPISLLNQKSYVGVLPANGTDNYYQLPDPTVYPGRTYIIRNNSCVDQANITTAAGLLFAGNSSAGGATYTLNPTTSPKTVMAISDGANWTIMVQN